MSIHPLIIHKHNVRPKTNTKPPREVLKKNDSRTFELPAESGEKGTCRTSPRMLIKDDSLHP